MEFSSNKWMTACKIAFLCFSCKKLQYHLHSIMTVNNAMQKCTAIKTLPKMSQGCHVSLKLLKNSLNLHWNIRKSQCRWKINFSLLNHTSISHFKDRVNIVHKSTSTCLAHTTFWCRKKHIISSFITLLLIHLKPKFVDYSLQIGL